MTNKDTHTVSEDRHFFVEINGESYRRGFEEFALGIWASTEHGIEYEEPYITEDEKEKHEVMRKIIEKAMRSIPDEDYVNYISFLQNKHA